MNFYLKIASQSTKVFMLCSILFQNVFLLKKYQAELQKLLEVFFKMLYFQSLNFP